MSVTQAIYDTLTGDTELTNLLSVYPAGGNPAVFAMDPIPEDATLPAVVISGPVSITPFDTKGGRDGQEHMRDIRCYAAGGGSVATIESIAQRVRELFHRKPISITDWTWVNATVTGPIEANELTEGSRIYGRIVTVTMLIDR